MKESTFQTINDQFKYKSEYTIYYDYLKYSLFPETYKIIYDRVYRPNIFEKISLCTIYNIRHKYTDLNKRLSSVESFKDVTKDSEQNIEEFMILQYYDNVFTELITSITFLSLFVFSKFKSFISPKTNTVPFIFIDNNRLLYNNLIPKNIQLKKYYMIVELSFMLLGCYYLARTVYNIKINKLSEEDKFKEKINKRIFILY